MTRDPRFFQTTFHPYFVGDRAQWPDSVRGEIGARFRTWGAIYCIQVFLWWRVLDIRWGRGRL